MHTQLGDRVEFIGINVGVNEREDGVRNYVEKKDIDFTVVFDKGSKITKKFGVMGTPTHIVVDRKGVVRYLDAEIPLDLEEHLAELES